MANLKCKCEAGERTNAAGQSAALLGRLQNPKVLRFIGLLPAMPYTGRVTGLPYRAGGRFRQLCVDERDVPGFLGQRYHAGPLFVLEADEPAPSPSPSPPVPQDPGQVLAELKALDGVGEKTASALMGAGFTVQMLASAQEADAKTIAEAADISESIAQRAIEGARAWAAAAEA